MDPNAKISNEKQIENPNSPSAIKDLLKMNNLFTENTQTNDLLDSNQKEKFLKVLMLIKYFSTMKICKEDNQPIELIDNLYIGSIGAASNKKGLQDNKITHVVIAASGLKEYFPDDFKYIKFELLDCESQNIKQHFIKAGEFIDEAIRNGGRVLVHCHAGISRSSTIILCYLIKYHKMRLDEALKMIRCKREKINPNNGFIKQLKEYEEECLGKE